MQSAELGTDAGHQLMRCDEDTEPPSSSQVLVATPLTSYHQATLFGGLSPEEPPVSPKNGRRNGRATVQSGYRRLHEPP
ncbi:MAG: hypothetical protein U0992_14760, partial [Planctomycetaceae bacterium]